MNFVCVVWMILGLCIDVLCDLLRKDIFLFVLMYKVNIFIVNFLKYKFCLINKDQQKFVWGGNYFEFDIILFYIFLCNLLIFLLFLNGWGNDLDKNDRSVFVNIERICLERNKYGYKFDIYLIDIVFNEKY